MTLELWMIPPAIFMVAVIFVAGMGTHSRLAWRERRRRAEEEDEYQRRRQLSSLDSWRPSVERRLLNLEDRAANTTSRTDP